MTVVLLRGTNSFQKGHSSVTELLRLTCLVTTSRWFHAGLGDFLPTKRFPAFMRRLFQSSISLCDSCLTLETATRPPFGHLAAMPQVRLLTRWNQICKSRTDLEKGKDGPRPGPCTLGYRCSGPSPSCAPPGEQETTGIIGCAHLNSPPSSAAVT